MRAKPEIEQFGNGRLRLFTWLKNAGFEEEEFRDKTYMTSITKCYPGPSPGGKGDRRPGKEEIEACSGFLQRELHLLQPQLIIPVGQMAISLLLGDMKLSAAVGKEFVRRFDDRETVLIPLPHPSGASLWNNLPENQALVSQAVRMLAKTKQDLEL